mmetsp:Transcript_54010/g.99418  ORF Transcript_54010/g.99418 Transcript_54010/m.99418 type:complete len:342 (-) Transcript_54010:108-1133(-)
MATRAESSNYASTASWCCFYGSGIICTLVVYGLLQERIMQIPYSGELFTFSTFLVFCNRMCNFIYAGAMSVGKGEALVNQAPLWKYLLVSFSNVGATTCQYEALKYVSFPVQMLGKSFKMAPVMLWGMAISGKWYTVTDWMVAACVTGGVTIFLKTGSISSPQDSSNSIYGLLLLLVFLALDGLTSTFQEKLFKEHKTSKYNQMFYINVFSASVSMVALIFSGQLMPALAFCTNHPAFLGDTALLSASATTSQFFIYSQVKEFGALVFAATMNVRQVVSILVSYCHYGHKITSQQMLALFLVFSALFYKSYAGLAAKKDQEPLGENTPLNVRRGDECKGSV